MGKKTVAIAVLLVALGISAFLVYRHLNPNLIHSFVVCGSVTSNGRPAINHKGQLFIMSGGQRYISQGNRDIVYSGQEDRSRAARTFVTNEKGHFCADAVNLKYYYKLGQFQIFALQLAPHAETKEKPVADEDPDLAARKPPMAPADGIELRIRSAELDQKANFLELETRFELNHGDQGASDEREPNDPAYKLLFNNEQRLARKQEKK